MERFPSDGACFFHCLHRLLLNAPSVAELRQLAGCAAGWAEEKHVQAAAAALDITLVLHPAEISRQPSVETSALQYIGMGATTLHLRLWTRGGDGVHFDVLVPQQPCEARKDGADADLPLNLIQRQDRSDVIPSSTSTSRPQSSRPAFPGTDHTGLSQDMQDITVVDLRSNHTSASSSTPAQISSSPLG